jgi:hypothetical protein
LVQFSFKIKQTTDKNDLLFFCCCYRFASDDKTKPGLQSLLLFEGTNFIANLNGLTIDLNNLDASSLAVVAATSVPELIAVVRISLANLSPINIFPNSNGQFVLGPLGSMPIPVLVTDGTFNISARAFSASEILFNEVTASVTVIAERTSVTATPVRRPTKAPTAKPTLSPRGTFLPLASDRVDPISSCALHPACSQLAGDCCPTSDGIVLSCCRRSPTQGTWSIFAWCEIFSSLW